MDANTNVLSETGLESLITELALAEDEIPRRAIKQARIHRDAVIPLLIDTVRDAARIKRQGGLVDSNGPYISLLLLTEFEAREALPAVVELISLPEEDLDALIGGGLTEDIHRILAVLADDQIDLLDGLARNPVLSEYVRHSAQTAMVMLVRDGKLARKSAVELLSDQLRHQLAEKSSQTTWTVGALCDLAAIEAVDEIAMAFDADLVDVSMNGDLEDVLETLHHGEAGMQRAFRYIYPSGYEDTIDELSWMEEVDRPKQPEHHVPEPRWTPETILREEPKVGRNDPCPCGSGRKFKKCCGRR